MKKVFNRGDMAQVSYYIKVGNNRALNRYFKVNSTLKMISGNRGVVMDCEIIVIDVMHNSNYTSEFIESIRKNELGKIKQINKCYEIE